MEIPQFITPGAFRNGHKHFRTFRLRSGHLTKPLVGMIGRFITAERPEKSKPNFVVAVVNSARPMDDLPSCLILRNVDSKKDEKQKKIEDTSQECRPVRNALREENVSPGAVPRHLSRKKKDFRPEIHIEGTSLNYQNLLPGPDDKDVRALYVQHSQDERTTSSSKDESHADVVAPNTEERNSVNTPDSISTSGDCAGQDVEENILGSDRIQRSLNPSPWKEIWSVLQDKSLANCPLSTKSVEFGRAEISESPFSIRTNPYTKPRREKPQRIPPLYNTRKKVSTTHGKATIPSFDTAVTFNTFFKGGQDTGVSLDIAKCKECVKLADLKDDGLQREGGCVHTYGKQEIKDKTERATGLPNITCPPTDRYKSKFRVRLLPLVTKSDSLPNLTSKTSSVPSELIVSAAMNVVTTSSENIYLGCPKGEDMKSDLVKESELMKKCRQNRSVSLDSVFSLQSFASYQAEKSASRKINVQGFKVLPDIKHAEEKKSEKPLQGQSDKEVSGIPRQKTVITLPWKCT